MRNLRQRRARGWALLMVMLIMAVVAIASAAVYSEAESSLVASTAVSAQQIALANAEFGLQVAIARLRQGQASNGHSPLMFVPPTSVCATPNPFSCATAARGSGLVRRSPSSPPPTNPPENSGVWSGSCNLEEKPAYQYVIVRRQTDLTEATQIPVVIRSIGYHGLCAPDPANVDAAPPDPNLATAIIEADMVLENRQNGNTQRENYDW